VQYSLQPTELIHGRAVSRDLLIDVDVTNPLW